jgi:hypothetical protein
LLATSLIVSVMPLLLARPFEVAGVAARLFALLPLERVVAARLFALLLLELVVRLVPLALLVLRVARLLDLEPFRVREGRFFAAAGELEALRPLRLVVDPERAPVALSPDFARPALARPPDAFEVPVFDWGSAIPHSSLAQQT